MLVFTSCTNNYIPKARILATSLKQFHPDWEFCLLLGEEPPAGFTIAQEPFDRVVLFEQIGIPAYHAWLFRHRVVEICTAAKGPALHYFATVEKHEKVIYLDPDIMVFNSLAPLVSLLDTYDILLTPHQLTPQTTQRSIIDNEICSLKHGVYNLGFVGIASRGQGLEFSQWWRDRLYDFCYDDIPNGIFTDQRWCDLAPAFFSRLHIIRDPGYNVASWNLTERTIKQTPDGAFMANDVPLRFYHFTGYDSGAGAIMTGVYGKDMPAVSTLWEIYGKRLEAFGHATLKTCKWKGMFFDDGTRIDDAMRLCYRNDPALQEYFPNPFCTQPPEQSFLQWYVHNAAPSATPTPDDVLRPQRSKIGKFKNLFCAYTARHGGVLRALPRMGVKVCATVKDSGLSGLVPKIRSAYRHLVQNTPAHPPASSYKTLQEYLPLLCTSFAPNSAGVCVLDHGYGGGANSYSLARIQSLREDGHSVLRVTWDIFAQNYAVSAFTPQGDVSFVMESLEDLSRQDSLHFASVLLNELVTWSCVENSPDEHDFTRILATLTWLEAFVKKQQASLEIPMHDYFCVCPCYTLLNSQDVFCDIPSMDTCNTCLAERFKRSGGDISLSLWRERWQQIFSLASKIVFFSAPSRNIVERVFTLDDDKVVLRPHAPLGLWNAPYTVPHDGPMTIAVIGTISTHKGARIVTELASLLQKDEKIVVIGELECNAPPSGNIQIHGRYQRDELPALLEQYRITIGFVPSIWPETFNYVTQECMLLGLPTVAFNIGAQGERIGAWEHGLLAQEINAASAYAALCRLDAQR